MVKRHTKEQHEQIKRPKTNENSHVLQRIAHVRRNNPRSTSYASEYLTPMMVCTCRRYDLKYMWVVCGVWFSGVFCVLCVASSYVVCDVCRVWCDMYRVCVA